MEPLHMVRDCDTEELAVPERDWLDPKFLATMAGLLLTCAVMVFTSGRNVEATRIAVGQISSVNDKLASIDTKLNAMAIDNNSKAKDIEFLGRTVQGLENRVDTVEKAYQFQVNTRLVRVEMKTGITPPKSQKEEE